MEYRVRKEFSGFTPTPDAEKEERFASRGNIGSRIDPIFFTLTLQKVRTSCPRCSSFFFFFIFISCSSSIANSAQTTAFLRFQRQRGSVSHSDRSKFVSPILIDNEDRVIRVSTFRWNFHVRWCDCHPLLFIHQGRLKTWILRFHREEVKEQRVLSFN